MAGSVDETIAQDCDRRFIGTVLQEGLLSPEQIEECRKTQERLIRDGKRRTLAEIAAQKTLITQSQADQIQKDTLPIEVPKMAGNYEIIRQIGEGGMGTVYKARHVKLGNYAAVKFLPPRLAQDSSFVQRFEREAKLAAQLTSPYSVRTFDVGEAAGTRMILMEYVEGESLDDLLSREGRLEEKRALRIIRDTACALAEAHEMGIIHRDIKPGNILLTKRGEPKLADLGLAKSMDAEQVNITSIGAILGTPSYMSPEQAMGLPDLDARTDIYSLGATLYRAVVGDLPFKGKTPVNVMHKIATEPLTEPLAVNPNLSQETAAIICKMMAKDRKARYQSMTEVIKDIDNVLAGEKTDLDYSKSVVLLNPQERTAATSAIVQRRSGSPALIAAVAAAGVLIVGLVAAWQFGLFRPTAQTTPPITSTSTGSTTPTIPTTTTTPAATTIPAGIRETPVTAEGLLAGARKAASEAKWAEARLLTQQLVSDFPGTPESAEAHSLLETATRQAMLDELLRLAATGNVLEAARQLKAARARWPDEKKIDELQPTLDAWIEKAYNEAMAQAAAAEKESDFDRAAQEYQKALDLRATSDAEAKLRSARLRRDLVVAVRGKDVETKLSALAEVLGKSSDADAQKLRGKMDELSAVRRQVSAAQADARRFREHMPDTARAAFLIAEEKCSRAEAQLETLDPLAMDTTPLDLLRSSFADAERQYRSAASSAFDARYPGIERELEGADFASGVLRLREAKQAWPGYARVAELLAKHDPDGALMTIAELVASAKPRAADYGSPKEAVEACAKLDEAWGRCTERKAAPGEEKKMSSLKALVLARRSAAHDAAGAPFEALADAVNAATFAGGTEKLADLIPLALAHSIEAFGRALKSGQGLEFARKAASLLSSPAYAGIRPALTKGVQEAPFVRDFMRDADAVRVWCTAVAPFVPPGMVGVPAGVYPLGLRRDEGLTRIAPSDSPEHPVKLERFFIDAREVTNKEYQEFVDSGGYAEDRWWTEAVGIDRKKFVDKTGKPGPLFWKEGRYPEGQEEYPVVGVSFYEAAAFARWNGKRLPTEAEWECAALGSMPVGGGETFAKQPFPWGEGDVRGIANIAEAGVGGPEPVGTRQRDKSSYGCIGMTGNVREWTASIYAPYPNTQCKDPKFDKGMISVRGASFEDPASMVSLTKRRATEKESRDAGIGFRCTWSLPGNPAGDAPGK